LLGTVEHGVGELGGERRRRLGLGDRLLRRLLLVSLHVARACLHLLAELLKIGRRYRTSASSA
jgi:hypothetical protein